MARKNRARALLIRGRRRRLQGDVVREQSSRRDQLLAARLELAHDQGAGQPQLPLDLVARAGACRGGDDEEAYRQDGDEQPHDDRHKPAAEALEVDDAHESSHLARFTLAPS